MERSADLRMEIRANLERLQSEMGRRDGADIHTCADIVDETLLLLASSEGWPTVRAR